MIELSNYAMYYNARCYETGNGDKHSDVCGNRNLDIDTFVDEYLYYGFNNVGHCHAMIIAQLWNNNENIYTSE